MVTPVPQGVQIKLAEAAGVESLLLVVLMMGVLVEMEQLTAVDQVVVVALKLRGPVPVTRARQTQAREVMVASQMPRQPVAVAVAVRATMAVLAEQVVVAGALDRQGLTVRLALFSSSSAVT